MSASAAVLVMSVAAAGAASADEVAPEPRDRTVVAREDVGPVNVRDRATTDSAVDRTIAPGGDAHGDCWLEGQHVSAYGVSSNIWIDVGDPPFDYEYIWAGVLKGDKYANLEPTDKC